MDLHIKGVHYDISDKTREFLSDKLRHIEPFKELLVSVGITITKEKSDYRVEGNVHFRWGTSIHITESAIDLYPAIENLMHKLDSKISKEKERIKEHHRKSKEPSME